jgi:hypothetical protein
MVSKKVIGGIIAVIAVVSVIALIPVFIYGFGVDAIKLNTGYGIAPPVSSAISGDGYNTQQYDLDNGTLVVEQTQVDAYSYFFGGFNGHVSVSEQGSSLNINVDIDISIDLDIKTPTGSINKTINTDIQGIINGDIDIIVGPDDGAIVNGTYYIWINIEISITITQPIEFSTSIQFNFTSTVDVIIQ